MQQRVRTEPGLPMKILTNRYALATAAALEAIALYLPALGNGFVWDDHQYIVDNQHIRSLNGAFFSWAMGGGNEAGVWQPLTWLSHALDYAFWGLNAAGHHLTSILLHGLNTFLVFFLAAALLEASAGNGRQEDHRGVLIASGVTAALFGLHPLGVESVAWIAERKDLLFCLFYLTAVLVYVKAAALPSVRQASGPAAWFRNRRLLLVVALSGLSLMSKPMAVTLPAVLLLLDWHPLGRIGSRGDLLRKTWEKAPLFLMSALVSLVTIIMQKDAGAVMPLDALPVADRILVAFRSLGRYVGHLLLPVGLEPLYLHSRVVSILQPAYFVPLILVAALTVVVLYRARRHPAGAAVWIFFLVTLLPVLGLVQAGSQETADRFTYLPALGPFLVAGAASASAWRRASSLAHRRSAARFLLGTVALLLFAALAAGTIRQIGVWKNGIELWNHIIENEPSRFPLAYINRGNALLAAGLADQAERDYATAIEQDPSGPVAYLAYMNRGILYRQEDQLDRALADLERAVILRPGHALSLLNRGIVFLDGGAYDRAVADFSEAIRLDPSLAPAFLNRGMAERMQGRLDDAVRDLQQVLRLDPSSVGAHVELGITFKMAGQFETAIEQYSAALAIDPGSVEALNNRGVVYKYLGQLDQAIADFSYALSLQPSYALAYCNRGIVFGMMGKDSQAIEDYSAAIRVDPDLVKAYLDRAELYRKRGDPDLALIDFREACSRGSREGCAAARNYGRSKTAR